MKTLKEKIWEIRRGIVLQTLLECGCNLTKSSKQLGIHRWHIDRMLKELEIDIKQVRRNFETANTMAEIKTNEQKRAEMLAKYANTYCMGEVPGGMLGMRGCGKPIPVNERYCEECKKRIEEQTKTPARGA